MSRTQKHVTVTESKGVTVSTYEDNTQPTLPESPSPKAVCRMWT